MVYVNRFIQRIEAFYIVLWSILGIIAITIDLYIALYLLCRLFKLSFLHPFLFPVAVIAAELAITPPYTTDVINFYTKMFSSYYDIGTIVIPLVLFAAAVYKARRQKVCSD